MPCAKSSLCGSFFVAVRLTTPIITNVTAKGADNRMDVKVSVSRWLHGFIPRCPAEIFSHGELQTYGGMGDISQSRIEAVFPEPESGI
jgi:hypothetical protein